MVFQSKAPAVQGERGSTVALPAAPSAQQGWKPAGCCCPGTQPDLFSLRKVPGIPPGIFGHGHSQEMDFPLPDIRGYANITPLVSGIGIGIDPSESKE